MSFLDRGFFANPHARFGSLSILDEDVLLEDVSQPEDETLFEVFDEVRINRRPLCKMGKADMLEAFA